MHDFGHLAERHLARGVHDADVVEVGVRERVVERQRNAREDRGDHEHDEVRLLHHGERVEAEHAAEASPV